MNDKRKPIEPLDENEVRLEAIRRKQEEDIKNMRKERDKAARQVDKTRSDA